MKYRGAAHSLFETTLILDMAALDPARDGDTRAWDESNVMTRTTIPPSMIVDVREGRDSVFQALLDRNIAREPARPSETLDLAGYLTRIS